MSSERQDLLAIGRLLNATPKAGDQDSCQLIASILEKLDESEAFAEEQLPDSLAFPEDLRQQVRLRDRWEQWDELKKLNELMRQDYTCRRQMLLNRLDCTVESFKWKSSTGGGGGGGDNTTNQRIHEEYDRPRRELKQEPQVQMAHLLAARDTDCDRLMNGVVSSRQFDCKVSCDQGRRQVNLKQVIIPHVPDRGGRTDEMREPTRESFASQQRGRNRRGR